MFALSLLSYLNRFDSDLVRGEYRLFVLFSVKKSAA
jgi:hypothetical protein